MHDKVPLVPLEERVWPDLNVDVQVARGPAARTAFALTAQAELHAVIDAAGDFHFQPHGPLLQPRTRTVGTAIANYTAGAVAARTRGLHAEESLRMHDAPAAAAIVASERLAARLGPRALARAAADVAPQFERARAALGRFQEIDGDGAAEMSAPLDAGAATSLAEEPVAKQVAECLEDVRNVGKLRSAVARHARVAEAIVAGPLIVVAEHVEGFGGLLEADDGPIVPGIAVGMIGDRGLFVGLLNLVGTGVLGDAQHFVVVPFRSHRNHI